MTEKSAANRFEKFKEKIAENGEVLFEDFWGKLNLSYKINGFESGFYFLAEFNFPAEQIQNFEREILLDKEIIRHLLVIVSSEKKQKFQPIQKKKKRPPRKKLVEKKSDPKKLENAETDKKVDKKELDEKLEKILSDDLEI